MRYTIRWFYVLKLSAVLVAAGVAVYFVHRWQEDRQQGAFLHQADRAKADGDADAEARLVERYLRAQPDDADARERLGRLLAAAAKSPPERYKAYEQMDAALRRDAGRDELRRLAAETAIGLGLFPEALAHTEKLLERAPGDPALELQAARCQGRLGKYREAADRLRRVVAAGAVTVEVAAGLVDLLRNQLNQPDEADAVVARLLADRPKDPRAVLVAADYWRSLGGDRRRPAAVAAKGLAAAQKLPPGETVGGAVGRLLATARELAPDDREVLLAVGLDLYQRAVEAAAAGERAGADRLAGEARAALTRSVDRDPKEPRGYLALAGLEADFGSPAEAAKVAGKGAAAVAEPRPLLLVQFDYQVRAGDPAGAEATLERLKAGGYSEARQVLHRARIQALRDDWEGAAAALSGLLAKKPPELADPVFVRQVNYALGRTLDQSGDPDRRLAAYRAALPPDPADPLWLPAHLGEADALVAAGKPDEALAAYRRQAARTAAVWLPVAGLELVKALRTPDPAKRDWAPAEEALGRAEKASPGAADVALLRADILSARGDPAAARKVVDGLAAARPKDPAVLAAVALWDLRDGGPDKAAKTLDAARAAGVDSVDLRVARAQVAAAAKDPDLARTLAELAKGSEALGKGPQRRLVRRLAEVAAAAGGPETAAGLLKQAADAQPNDIGLHLARFDLAMRGADEKAVEAAAADVRRVDGENGAHARLVGGLAALWRAQRKNDRSGLAAARTALEALEKDRPDWARAALVLADICYLLKDPAAALPRYERAVKAGEAAPDAVRRLVELSLDAGRPDQALEAFRRLPPAYADRPDVARLKARVLARTDPKAALAAAEPTVPADGKDPALHLWVGQLAAAAREWGKAEAAVRRAVALQPDRAGPWLDLVTIQRAAGRPDDAARTAAEAEGKVAPADRDGFAAQAALVLGRRAEAGARLAKARAARPDDPQAVLAEAEFLYRENRLGDARPGLERALTLPGLTDPQRAAVTRMLAVCLAADPDPATSRRALALLGYVDDRGQPKPPPADETPAARRTRAVVLALQKDRASKLKATELLEENLGGLDPNELYLLAGLQNAVGNQPRVRLALGALLRKADDAPLYLAWAAGWYLRADDPAAAAPVVEKLAKLQPDALVTAELRARLAAARKQPDEARKILAPWADKSNAPLLTVANLFEQVGLPDDAERVHRRAAEAGKGALLPLAEFLGRRGRAGDALGVIDQARAAGVPVLPEAHPGGGLVLGWGAVAVASVYADKARSAADLARLAGWLEEAAKAAPAAAKPAVGQLLASVKDFQVDYAGAIALYDQAVKADDRDLVALNNLAFLLAAKDGQPDRALKLLDRAQQVAGPLPDLLDTRAIVLIGSGRPGAAEEAVGLLKVVTAEAPTGVAFFHLAQAELAANRPDEARDAWRQAVRHKLAPTDLHPLERPGYDKLAAKFK